MGSAKGKYPEKGRWDQQQTHCGSFPEGLFLEAAYTRAHEMSRPCLLLYPVDGVPNSNCSVLFIALKQAAANQHGRCY